MKNPSHTLSSIKLSLQVELPPLPSEIGVFDSFRGDIVENQLCVSFLPRHFSRFQEGASLLKATAQKNETFSLTYQELVSGLQSIFQNRTMTDTLGEAPHSFRFRLWSNLNEIKIDAAPFEGRYQNISGAQLFTSQLKRNLDFKYTPALESILSFQHAQEKGGHEGLLVNENQKILEASWSNFFWIDSDHRICATGKGLKGIAQSVLAELYKDRFIVKSICTQELLNVRPCCFITNALHGITPVSSVNSISMNTCSQIQDIKRCYEDYSQTDKEVTWIPINS